MVNLVSGDNKLRVFITKNERIKLSVAKQLIRKSKRMIQQNSLAEVVIDLDNNPRIDKSALDFVNRVLCKNNFPIAIINS